MKRNLLISALCSTVAAFAGEHMTVAVCNVGELPAQVIERAEAEAAYVFQSMGVEIRWTGCGAEVDAADARVRPDFIVRVRIGGHLPKAGDTSLEAMGRAFMNVDGTGQHGRRLLRRNPRTDLLCPIAGADQVMGYTMAHKLGHLLIGHLKFNAAEQAAILRHLQSR